MVFHLNTIIKNTFKPTINNIQLVILYSLILKSDNIVQKLDIQVHQAVDHICF